MGPRFYGTDGGRSAVKNGTAIRVSCGSNRATGFDGDHRETARVADWVSSQARRLPECSSGIADVVLAPLAASTSYDCYDVEVHLVAGGRLRLFLKDLRHSKLQKAAPAASSQREVATYERLLSQASLGTARYVGSRLDHATGRHLLLLGHVPGDVLAYLPFRYGALAMEWLGRLHVTFSDVGDLADQAPFLIVRDLDWYRRLVAAAAAHGSRKLPERRQEVLDLVEAFVAMVPEMLRLPRTLVHGDYRAAQVICDRSSRAAQVVPVDWESASCGVGLVDVAAFTDGFGGRALTGLLRAYAGGLAASGRRGDPPVTRADLVPFRMERVMRWLADSEWKGFSATALAEVVDYGQAILRGSDDDAVRCDGEERS